MLNEVISARDFGRLEEKVDTILANQERFRQEHRTLDKRVDKLESTNDRKAGGMSVFAVLAGLIGSAVTAGIGHFLK